MEGRGQEHDETGWMRWDESGRDHSMDGVGQNGERSDCGWYGITGDRWDRMGWE